MPVNKNAYLRFRIIDQCLNNPYKKYNRYDLANAIEHKLGQSISIDSVSKDLNSMKYDLDAPIENDRLNRHYFYSTPFSLNKLVLNDAEESALQMSLSVLDVLKDTKYAASYKTLIQRLITQASGYHKNDIIEFEQAVKHSGLDWFDRLYESINDEQTIVITYQAYGKEVSKIIVSPYMLKEYKNRFYLVARMHKNEPTELIYCYGLDRIKAIEKSKEVFLRTKGFNSKNYFKDSLGITRKLDEKPIELTLRFNEKNSYYVLSNPIHHSQKEIKRTKDSLTISICVYESDELNMLILSYGAGVEVLSPPSYIDYIKKVAKDVAKVYKNK